MGTHLRKIHGQRVHKLAIHAGFICPNMDGTSGRGGCSFCNNASFSPQVREHHSGEVARQLATGRCVIAKRTGAKRYLAYFQAYTNTYGELDYLKRLYDEALEQPGVLGLAVGTRPDCVPDAVLDLLASYQDQGYEVWLELGLQSAFDETLQRVNRGHGFIQYKDAISRAHRRNLSVCTHLIVGLPGERGWHAQKTLQRVLECNTQGLKLHPLHVVRGTSLARLWQRGEYRPLGFEEYLGIAADLIEMTPPDVVFHRLTATVRPPLLLAPDWCAYKWRVLNGIERELDGRNSYQGMRISEYACFAKQPGT